MLYRVIFATFAKESRKRPVDSALSLNYGVHRPVACQVGIQ